MQPRQCFTLYFRWSKDIFLYFILAVKLACHEFVLVAIFNIQCGIFSLLFTFVRIHSWSSYNASLSWRHVPLFLHLLALAWGEYFIARVCISNVLFLAVPCYASSISHLLCYLAFTRTKLRRFHSAFFMSHLNTFMFTCVIFSFMML